MVNVIFEIMKKEMSSYYSQKSIILRNVVFMALFGALTIYQLTQVIDKYGTTATVISAGLNVLLAFAAIFPVNMAGGISVMAFPVERDQKTLEHLLSLPLSDSDIFLGKFLAAVIAGLAGLVVIFSVVFGFTLLNYHITWDAPLFTGALSLMTFVICPLLVVLLILATVIVSSRISARETYIINIFSVFVVLSLNIAVAAFNVDTLTFNAGLTAILVPLIIILYVIGTRTFNRESLIKSL